eukprot:CAMPEP_0202861760 /NCGR_PEP_ID=MMETSP1391-20130828/3050_1 /ASSEMBLY_ACC=CAM_ASM_000867 /TAXON_ID=1034604 /ORGANISM="Chlamydomonas leiostraca, Strain SAG 11-49" /LENGTH=220 /DNA_ID=CAMNT_0049541195 /DNA_START=17 /DNA_END=679 /DNA_ORIENTATION=-
MGLKTTHLFLYNSIQAVGWAVCLYKLAIAYSSMQKPDQAYAEAKDFAKVFQGASILEVVHAAIGIVPSSPAMALLQWAGRSHILYLVLDAVPQVQSSPASVVLLAAWSVSEIIRYPWYALSAIGACPSFLTWLRYTAFIPLYPVGVGAELALLWQGLPHLAARGAYSLRLPNQLNWGFDYKIFAQMVMVIYLPAWWQLYTGLLRARKKRLGGGGSKAKAE